MEETPFSPAKIPNPLFGIEASSLIHSSCFPAKFELFIKPNVLASMVTSFDNNLFIKAV